MSEIVKEFCRTRHAPYLNYLTMEDKNDVFKLVDALIRKKYKPRNKSEFSDDTVYYSILVWAELQRNYIRPAELVNLSEKNILKSILDKFKKQKISPARLETCFKHHDDYTNTNTITNIVTKVPDVPITPPTPENLIKNLLAKNNLFQFDSFIFYQIPVQIALEREKYGPKCMSDMLAYLGFENLPENTMYDLLCYLYVYEEPLRTGLTNEENRYLSKLSLEKLTELIRANIPPKVNKHVLMFTKASALFTLNSGFTVDDFFPDNTRDLTKEKSYISVQSMPSNLILYATKHGATKNATPIEKFRTGPYHYVGQIAKNLKGEKDIYLEKLYKIYKTNRKIADKIIMDLFLLNNRLSTLAKHYIPDEHNNSYINNLVKLDNSGIPIISPQFTKNDHLEFYRLIRNDMADRGINFDTNPMEKILENYTTYDLATYYKHDISESNNTREYLLFKILEMYQDNSWYMYTGNECQNDLLVDPISLDKKSDINKYNPDDPTFVYGIPGVGMCYQLDELMAAFEPIDGVYRFINPDFTGRDTLVDQITGERIGKEFSINCIKNLRHLVYDALDTAQDKLIIIPYKDKLEKFLMLIDKGLEYNSDVAKNLNKMIAQYRSFTLEQTQLVNKVFTWLFMFGMWMRFWRGPGYLWPEERIKLLSEKQREEQGRCDEQERDGYTTIQGRVYTLLREKMTKQGIINWFDKLPMINYKFRTNPNIHTTISSYETINQDLEGLFSGKDCQGIGGDIIPTCAYVYITRKLPSNIMSDSDFVLYLEKYLPPILDDESIVVNNLISEFNPTEIKSGESEIKLVTAIKRRKQALSKSHTGIKLPPFDTNKFMPNLHTRREQDV